MADNQPTAVAYELQVDGKTYYINHPSLAGHYSLAAQIAATHAHIELTLDAVIWAMSEFERGRYHGTNDRPATSHKRYNQHSDLIECERRCRFGQKG